MKKIKLTKGQYTLIDNEDFQRISRYRWHAYYDKTIMSFYARTTLYKKRIKKNITLSMHRFIMNATPKKIIDHINHNTLDNRKNNLRLCNRKESARNTRKLKGVSIFKGVCLYKPRMNWRARIRAKEKTIYLGYFNNQKQAALAYDKAARKYYGEFAYTNF